MIDAFLIFCNKVYKNTVIDYIIDIYCTVTDLQDWQKQFRVGLAKIG